MELIRYLHEHFFSEEQLLAVSGIALAELTELQARAMLPQASYRLQLDVQCMSYFGPYKQHAQLAYYAKGYASWIGLLQSLGSEADAFGTFAQRYRDRLHQLTQAGMCTRDPRFHAGLDQFLREEWAHFLEGTYGLCTKTGLPEDIAAKSLGTAIVEEITGNSPERALTAHDRVCLTLAVDLLDTASTPFAPHERTRSSRQRLIDDVRHTYGI